VRYSIVFLVGIGATLAWQSYGNEAMEMVRMEVPSVAWLLPDSTAKPPPDGQTSAAAVVPSAEVVQQLKPMAVDLAIVRRNQEQLAIKVEHLAARQEQMAQNIATLQSDEQEVIRKLSSPPQPRAAPVPKPPQPAGQSSATQSPSVARPVPPAGQTLRWFFSLIQIPATSLDLLGPTNNRPLVFSLDQIDHCFLKFAIPVRVSLNIRNCELTIGFHAPFISRDLRLSPRPSLGLFDCRLECIEWGTR
jgi:hypothetical protein